MESGTELSLIERLRNGDTGALEPLMDRYAARVYRLAHGITRNEADAERASAEQALAKSKPAKAKASKQKPTAKPEPLSPDELDL